MEFKDYLVIIVIFVVLLGIYHFTFKNNPNLGLIVWQDKMDFRNGFSINGTDALDSSRNASFGTISGSTGTFSSTLGVTGAATLSSSLAVTGATTLTGTTTQVRNQRWGTSSSSPACIMLYNSLGAVYLDFATTSGDGTVIATTTKPAECP